MPETVPESMPEAPPRPTSGPRLLIAAFVAYSLAHLFNNTVLERNGPRVVLQRLQIASGGWIEPLLVRSQVVLLAFLVVVAFYGGRRFSTLGWRARAFVPGLLITLGAWCVLQLGLLAAVLRQGIELEWHPMWTRFGLPAVLGGVLAQALGHALVEDTAFRGFFLPELRRGLARPASIFALLWGFALAVVGSALLFGLAHLPTRILLNGLDWRDLLQEQMHFLTAGMALGLAFVATRNLFAVVGLHVLLNDPAPIVAVPGAVLNQAILVVFGGVVLIGFSRRIHRWRAARRAVEPAVRVAAEAEIERAA